MRAWGEDAMTMVECSSPLGLGIVGLGGAAVNMLPSFQRSPYFQLVAAADSDATTLGRFRQNVPGVENL